MTEPNGNYALIIEGIVAENGNGGGISAIIVVQQIDRIRSGALQIADAAEILRGISPTTAEIRAEWRQMKRGK